MNESLIFVSCFIPAQTFYYRLLPHAAVACAYSNHVLLSLFCSYGFSRQTHFDF